MTNKSHTNKSSGWTTKFHAPIPRPEGSPIKTLAAARDLVLNLNKADREQPAWQAAAQALLMAADSRNTSIADIAMRQAINGPHEEVFDPNAKTTHWRQRRKQDPWR